MGPAVATWRFFNTLNKIERKLNGDTAKWHLDNQEWEKKG